LVRSGSSVGLCLPAVYARALGWSRGDEVRVYLVGQVVCVQKLEAGNFTPRVIAITTPPLMTLTEESANNAPR
jgi:antitoxin component of MazEF toxin-antitoxin module